MDKLFQLVQLPNKGRGLVAMEKLPKGQLLFAERPIVALLRENQLGKYCSYCFNPLQESEIEHESMYDTFHEDCNEIGWNEFHFKTAGVRNRDYKVSDDKKFPIMARLILADTLEKSLSGEETLWNGILGHLCYANNKEWKTDETPYYEFINYLLFTAKISIKKSEIMNIVPFEMYDRIVRTLHLNCITITHNEEDVATGLFGLASIFNHSCDPNVEMKSTMENKSGFAKFHCIRDVDAGEELCIQYAGKNDVFEDRQKYLMWVYGFQCQCKKCRRDQTVIDAKKILNS